MTVPNPHDSKAQRDAETEILATLSAELGVPLTPTRLPLGEGITVAVDGVDPSGQTLVEVYARVGVLRSSQLDKVAKDILKLSLLSASQTVSVRPRIIMAFASEEALGSVRGWRRFTADTLGIELRVVELTPETRAAVEAAQSAQMMVGVA